MELDQVKLKIEELRRAGEYVEALALVDGAISAVSDKSDHADWLGYKGALLCEIGQISEGLSAVRHARELLADEPRTSTPGRFKLEYCLAEYSDEPERSVSTKTALELSEEAVATAAPGNDKAHALLMRAALLELSGAPTKALTSLRYATAEATDRETKLHAALARMKLLCAEQGIDKAQNYFGSTIEPLAAELPESKALISCSIGECFWESGCTSSK